MIKKTTEKNKVKVTFVLPAGAEQGSVAVVGDFNNWDSSAHRLVKRSNGTYSVSALLDPDQRYRFRYYAGEGRWFNDEAADGYELGEHGSENCVLLT